MQRAVLLARANSGPDECLHNALQIGRKTFFAAAAAAATVVLEVNVSEPFPGEHAA